jgi:hypothetical protein
VAGASKLIWPIVGIFRGFPNKSTDVNSFFHNFGTKMAENSAKEFLALHYGSK